MVDFSTSKRHELKLDDDLRPFYSKMVDFSTSKRHELKLDDDLRPFYLPLF